MTQFKSYQFRIYPTEAHEKLLSQFFGAKRWVYNYFLTENIRRYQSGEKHLSHFDINAKITEMKCNIETLWFCDMDDWALKCSAEDLSRAYSNFFSSITGKRKGPKVSLPKFKSKSNKQTYRTRYVSCDFENNTIKLPKLTNIKCSFDRDITGKKIKSATVSKTPSGKYFVNVLVEEDIQLKPTTHREVGIDLGLKDLCILSNGIKFEHPEAMLAKAKLALKKQQKIFSRTKKGSKNHEKQRIKVARCYEKLTNIRNWYYHNISTYLVENFDSIYMENLNVAFLLKNRKLSRKIHETAWSTLVSMIQYKANWAGRTFHQIGRFVPSSKTCSCCGYKLDILDLGTREWECPSCKVNHDRDLNAAINIKDFGQLDCYDQIITSVETIEEGFLIPLSLKKFATKIERSLVLNRVGDGIWKFNILC